MKKEKREKEKKRKRKKMNGKAGICIAQQLKDAHVLLAVIQCVRFGRIWE